jgi:ribosomal protein S18 acetylase RimI-like enzyme
VFEEFIYNKNLRHLKMITKVSGQSDFNVLAKLLNEAFATVAQDFGLTKENCPTNNAFITPDDLRLQLTGSREFYSYMDRDQPVGFIAVERSSRDPEIFYIEKVAVHPDFRHRDIGYLLMDYATERITILGGKRISIGLIDANEILKKWYQAQGYSTVEIKTYEHLPFDVCIMEKLIN